MYPRTIDLIEDVLISLERLENECAMTDPRLRVMCLDLLHKSDSGLIHVLLKGGCPSKRLTKILKHRKVTPFSRAWWRRCSEIYAEADRLA